LQKCEALIFFAVNKLTHAHFIMNSSNTQSLKDIRYAITYIDTNAHGGIRKSLLDKLRDREEELVEAIRGEEWLEQSKED